jgi:hypothetical protein
MKMMDRIKSGKGASGRTAKFTGKRGGKSRSRR